MPSSHALAPGVASIALPSGGIEVLEVPTSRLIRGLVADMDGRLVSQAEVQVPGRKERE